ncbi:MAG TPA: nicotinate phosphoribosyltransferase [Bacillus sp. (in: firmicutes)]|uniref:nicotinate phosphoribosyltransferase n=1 Tax=Bacillus litorisediminis TaxID=2922713 RepID=UPI001FAFD3CC|nr:nicotinate phosphoribosyltransferase [Bacillus litorisediminis]HWO74481.1 nicotinate phosphoribosyltransferase [Bacillus sp. (in: firmicutes)]
MNIQDLALHTDKYEINMMYAHWMNGTMNDRAVFEAYFRKLPFGNGYAVFAGLQRIVEYIRNLRFSEDDIQYLSEQEEQYDPAFLQMLRDFRFSGNLYSVQEGEVVFPNEPLLRVEGTILETQLVETAILNFLNYQTLIATKASRIVRVAAGDGLLEFGSRRAQEADAAVWGARAAYIAGFDATSNMLAGKLFGIPTKGTHAHSWVQGHDSEEESFIKYANALPDQVALLVDTYDTLEKGIPNAIKTAHMLERKGKRMQSIRIDSGDLAYLSKKAREQLDKAGLDYVKIVVSNDLDEHLIFNLKAQGAKVDTWGVGTRLITAEDQPSLGGVYKLVAREKNGELIPVIKISGNQEKITTPGKKEVFRLIDQTSGKAISDYIAQASEKDILTRDRIELCDPLQPHISQFAENFKAIQLLHPVILNGELVYDLPDLQQIRSFHREQMKLFEPELLRLLNPEIYPVHLSPKTWQLKMDMILEYKKEIRLERV